jgi:hypothetical protein
MNDETVPSTSSWRSSVEGTPSRGRSGQRPPDVLDESALDEPAASFAEDLVRVSLGTPYANVAKPPTSDR